MRNRQILSVTLSVLFSVSFLAAGATEQEKDGLATRKHDPFLASMRNFLQKRECSPEELDKLKAYIQVHPDDPDGHLVLANAYNKMGMEGMYAEELEKAWHLSPDSLMYLFVALKARAITDDHTSYDRLVDEAFQTFQQDKQKLEKLGQLFQDNNENELALRFLTRALELDRQDLQVLCTYCNSLMACKKYKELIRAAAPLFGRDNTRALACLLTGVAWYNLNQLDKAVPLLAKAYRGAPDRPEIAEAYFDVLMAEGKESEALEPALMALALQPPFSAHMTALKAKVKPVIARASTSDLQEGIKQVTLNMPPYRPLAFFFFALGDLLDKSDRVLNAANCFSKGLSLDPTLGRAYMRLGYSMEKLGEPPEKVFALYRQAAQRVSEDKEVTARYERMKARIPALDKDIAGKMKSVINNLRYKS
jgi:tetratricopeptide (TPR) repeat protein